MSTATTRPVRSFIALPSAALVAALGLVVVSARPASAGTVTVPFAYTGAAQTWTVPANVHHITITAIGASGGTGGDFAPAPGLGAMAQGAIAVTPNEVLQVNVGGKGTDGRTLDSASSCDTRQFAGTGGGGGGASDVRGAPDGLADRLVVGGGGGGSGGGGSQEDAGTGSALPGGPGGAGGYPDGGAGHQGDGTSSPPADAGGGTQVGGGGGGTGGSSAGASGSSGTGGNGAGPGDTFCTTDANVALTGGVGGFNGGGTGGGAGVLNTFGIAGGGGGGGGLNGGGGGAAGQSLGANPDPGNGGTGGGGGSSLVPSGGQGDTPSAAANTGDGSVSIAYKVSPAATLTSSASPSVFGQSVTFTDTLCGTGATPTGSVSFTDGTSSLGSSVLSPGGGTNCAQATLSMAGLTTATHPITASYGGDPNLDGVDASLSQVVNKADTTVALSPVPTTSVFGQQVTLTATVSPSSPSTAPSAAPSGTVVFKVDGNTLASLSVTQGSPTAIQSRVSYATTGLPVGPHTMSAAYLGDGNFNSGTDTASQQVNKADTNLALNGPTSVPFGSPVVFTATVGPKAPSTNPPSPPSGSVPFSVDGAPVAVAALNGGVPTATQSQASYSSATLVPGTHTIAASYGGDGSFNGSGPVTTTVTVTCDHSLSGSQRGLTLSGGSWCLSGANVTGTILVTAGTSVAIVGSTVSGAVIASGGGLFALCGSQVGGALSVSHATGFVVVGDPHDDACAGNTIGGGVSLSSDQAGVEISHNSSIGGTLWLSNDRGTTTLDDSAPEVESNGIRGSLVCSGDVPVATDDLQPNTVSGSRTGECGAAGF
jgi:hypothetical protein